jgi:hypothetical protein
MTKKTIEKYVLEPIIFEAFEFVSSKVDKNKCFAFSKAVFRQNLDKVVFHKKPLQPCRIFELPFFDLGNSVFC